MASLSTFRVEHPEELNRVVTPITRDVAASVADDASHRSPTDTGRLQAGWRVEPDEHGSWRVVNAVPYARFVEYGTRDTRPVGMLAQAVAQGRARYG